MNTIEVTHNGVVKTVKAFPNRRRGLGDLVEIVAKPIAKVADKFLGTNLRNCGKCKKRKEKLNNRFPLTTRR